MCEYLNLGLVSRAGVKRSFALPELTASMVRVLSSFAMISNLFSMGKEPCSSVSSTGEADSAVVGKSVIMSERITNVELIALSLILRLNLHPNMGGKRISHVIMMTIQRESSSQ